MRMLDPFTCIGASLRLGDSRSRLEYDARRTDPYLQVTPTSNWLSIAQRSAFVSQPEGQSDPARIESLDYNFFVPRDSTLAGSNATDVPEQISPLTGEDGLSIPAVVL